MSKKPKVKTTDFEKVIMAKVNSNEISMKPRWYFILGSSLMIIGLAGFSIVAVFLTNLIFFLLRQHGPMGQWRLQYLLNSFPLWVPILALAGTVLGILILRKYDFSYKKNIWLIISGFIISIIVAAYILNYLGLNQRWSRRGPMRRFYQQIQENNSPSTGSPGQRRMQKGWGNKYR